MRGIYIYMSLGEKYRCTDEEYICLLVKSIGVLMSISLQVKSVCVLIRNVNISTGERYWCTDDL